MLFGLYSDPVNKLYLIFLRPILQKVQHRVTAFQGENVHPHKFQLDLGNLIIATSRKVILPTSKVNPLASNIASYVDPRAYFGNEPEHFCANARVTEEEQKVVQERCINFAVTLCNEL